MQTFKSLLIVAVLGVVAYGMYALLTGGGRGSEDATADEWTDVPRIAQADTPKVVLPETAPAPLPTATAAVTSTIRASHVIEVRSGHPACRGPLDGPPRDPRHRPRRVRLRHALEEP